MTRIVTAIPTSTLIEASEGAEAKQLTTWKGPDSQPSFSPDGAKIAYLQGGPPKYSGYDPQLSWR